LSVAKLLADLQAQRASLDKAIAILESIRDGRVEPYTTPNAGRRSKCRTMRRRASSTKPATVIVFPSLPPVREASSR